MPSSRPTVDAAQLADELLRAAVAARASDLHVEPTLAGCDVKFRVDGLLQTLHTLDASIGKCLVTRLMVMGQLLTYRLDVPQEGRISFTDDDRVLDLRVAVIPTVHGLRAAVRLPAELDAPESLETLQLPPAVLEDLKRFSDTDAGMLIVTGPAGSGKTTTIYALLHHIANSGKGLSIVSLEDPVERQISGVTQIEVTPFGEMTYERALRSILRQDPQVLMIGEIRDSETAALAVQAALSGHRLICTLHAASPGGAIARLLEMGIEPYRITSSVWGVMTQRLLRKRTEQSDSSEYHGRTPIAELLRMNDALRQAVLQRADAATLQRIASQQPGYRTLRDSANELASRGITDEAELVRILGTDEET